MDFHQAGFSRKNESVLGSLNNLTYLLGYVHHASVGLPTSSLRRHSSASSHTASLNQLDTCTSSSVLLSYVRADRAPRA